MHESDADMLARLEAELKDPVRTAIEAPTSAELAEVRASAEARAASGDAPDPDALAGRRRLRPTLAWAALVAAFLLVGGVAGVVLWRSPDSAFAAARAAEALVPSVEALHIVQSLQYSRDSTVTSPEAVLAHGIPATGAVDAAPAAGSPATRLDILLAPGGGASRIRTLEASSGRVFTDEVNLGPDGHARTASYPAVNEVLGQATPGEVRRMLAGKRYTVVEDEPLFASGPPGILGAKPTYVVSWWIELRNDLRSGKAKVLGTETLDGVDYWHVRSVDTTWSGSTFWELRDGAWRVMRQDPYPAMKRSVDALLRVGDYRPLYATITYITDNGTDATGVDRPWPGRYHVNATTYAVTTWDEVAPSSLPADTFQLASISTTDAALVDLRYLPREVARFRDFGVWGMRDSWRPGGSPVSSRPNIDEGVYYFMKTPPGVPQPWAEGAGGAGPFPTGLAPFPYSEASSQWAHAAWSALNGDMSIQVATCPRLATATVDAFLTRERLGKSTPLDVTVGGVRFQGAWVDSKDAFHATSIGQDGATTIVVSIRAPWQHSDPRLVGEVLRALERKNP